MGKELERQLREKRKEDKGSSTEIANRSKVSTGCRLKASQYGEEMIEEDFATHQLVQS
jgi:hypothetical protein